MKTVGLLHDLVSLEKAVSVSQKDIPLERQLAKWHNDGNLFWYDLHPAHQQYQLFCVICNLAKPIFMKNIFIAFFLLSSFSSTGQNLRTYQYGRQTLTGKVMLKNLRNPISGRTIRDAMVLVLPRPITFVPGPVDKEGSNVKIREIRIYGNLDRLAGPDVKYKRIIGKKVAITANFVSAPSSNYPLPVNVIEDFSYTILK